MLQSHSLFRTLETVERSLAQTIYSHGSLILRSCTRQTHNCRSVHHGKCVKFSKFGLCVLRFQKRRSVSHQLHFFMISIRTTWLIMAVAERVMKTDALHLSLT